MLFGRKDATQLDFVLFTLLILTFFFRKIIVYTNWWIHMWYRGLKQRSLNIECHLFNALWC